LLLAVPTEAGALGPCSTVNASAFEIEVEGSLGSGAGESTCSCGAAKIAIRASPAAAIRPRKAKVVARIRSMRLPPAKFGTRRAERSLL
jgi:hypothetical protein